MEKEEKHTQQLQRLMEKLNDLCGDSIVRMTDARLNKDVVRLPGARIKRNSMIYVGTP